MFLKIILDAQDKIMLLLFLDTEQMQKMVITGLFGTAGVATGAKMVGSKLQEEQIIWELKSRAHGEYQNFKKTFLGRVWLHIV